MLLSTPLLTTKLYIPPLRPLRSVLSGDEGLRRVVPRPRLVERLNEGLRAGRTLTLLSAPAGFGKTTLVSEWIAQVLDIGDWRLDNAATDPSPIPNPQSHKFAWLSLDEGDNDPTRFLAYLIAALQTVVAEVGKGVLSALQSPQPPPTEAVLISLINEIAALPDRMVLVLDDYHLIEAQPIHDALTFLLEHLPPPDRGLHLVIATREDPQLPLARLRSRGQLTELRAADLRFTASEAAEFLNQVMGLNLSLEDIAALETKTEGWIAGLQLAALALQGTLSVQGHKDASSRIQSFTGSHRFVLDYLIEEVLDQQPASVQTFLLQTCILDRLTGSLCDAVRFGYAESPSGQNGSRAILEALEAANLFIVPLDEERRWYRYHHLFAELLRQRLKVTHPDVIDDLHARAVIWYETHDDLPQAIRHALLIDDVETATRLIEKGALQALERSQLRFILKWVDRLPETALESAPALFIYHAWALLLTGQVEGASARLENIEWLLKAIEAYDETEKQEMLGFIAGLRAVLALWRRDFSSGFDFANQALAYLPENNWIRGYCAIVLGSGFWGKGQLDAAREAYAESYAVGKASGNKMLAVSAACNRAYMLELEGHLQQALKLFRDAFQLAEQDGQVLPVAGYIHVDMARLLYQLGDLDAASRNLHTGIELCRRMADGRAEKIGYCLLARVQIAQGKHADVRASIQKAEAADPSPGTPFDLRGGEYPQVRLWLKENKLTDLEAWLEESGVNLADVSHFGIRYTYTMHARVLMALGREHPDGAYLSRALDLLEELSEMAETNGWGSKVIEILSLQALVYQAQGDTARAMTALQRALSLAEPEGYIRIFVDEGPPMARLLYTAATRGMAPDYVRRLLAAFPDVEPEPPGLPSTQAPASELIEPLSERELEVLQLLAEGLTNPEIAARLYLSPNTIKVHTRNIYGKLGVKNRTQAGARARALGILSATRSRRTQKSKT